LGTENVEPCFGTRHLSDTSAHTSVAYQTILKPFLVAATCFAVIPRVPSTTQRVSACALGQTGLSLFPALRFLVPTLLVDLTVINHRTKIIPMACLQTTQAGQRPRSCNSPVSCCCVLFRDARHVRTARHGGESTWQSSLWACRPYVLP
jgi:hypothetical protein